MNLGPTCKRCGEEYSLPNGFEPTDFCNLCAHIIAGTAVKALERIYGLTHHKRTSGIAMAMQDIAHEALSELRKAVET